MRGSGARVKPAEVPVVALAHDIELHAIFDWLEGAAAAATSATKSSSAAQASKAFGLIPLMGRRGTGS